MDKDVVELQFWLQGKNKSTLPHPQLILHTPGQLAERRPTILPHLQEEKMCFFKNTSDHAPLGEYSW